MPSDRQEARSAAKTIEQRMVEQVDRLSETLIERNAEIKRLREALARIAQHSGFPTDTPSWRDIAREALRDAK